MAGTCGADRVNGDAGIAISTIFETNRTRQGRGHLAVDLTFGGTRTNRTPANQVSDILADHHIQEFGGGWHPQLVNSEQYFTRQFDAIVNAIRTVKLWIRN